MIEVSVIVPVYNEEKFIDNFIKSLLKQSNLNQRYEIIFVDNYSTDNTFEKLLDFEKADLPFCVRVVRNSKRIISSSLNIGLKESKGKYILRLDVHSKIPVNYFNEIIDLLKMDSSKYCNVGGRTIAQGYDINSEIVAKAMRSKWVLGGASFRFSNTLTEVDTVFPGAWLKKDLEEIDGWDENWKINEDVELNCRLKKFTNKKILMDPKIVINYFPRNAAKKLWEQYFNYGYWRVKTANKHEESVRVTHLLPLILLIGILLCLILVFININLLIWFAVLSLLLYSFYLLFVSVSLYKGSILKLFKGMLYIATLHISWALGGLKGYICFGFPLKGYINLFKKYT